MLYLLFREIMNLDLAIELVFYDVILQIITIPITFSIACQFSRTEIALISESVNFAILLKHGEKAYA